jgi:two-component system, chemotaxis family, protein-glutamate methylesterase/glutaminase
MKIRDEHPLRYRCHTGHAFTAHNLLAALNDSTEDAIWSGVRALQEGAMLLDHLAQHARDAGQSAEARALDREVRGRLQRAEMIRNVIVQLPARRNDAAAD